jgi:hypothetical protein
MILRAIAEKLKRRSRDDFKGRYFEASLILQAVSWYLRCPLSYCDIKAGFLQAFTTKRPGNLSASLQRGRVTRSPSAP